MLIAEVNLRKLIKFRLLLNIQTYSIRIEYIEPELEGELLPCLKLSNKLVYSMGAIQLWGISEHIEQDIQGYETLRHVHIAIRTYGANSYSGERSAKPSRDTQSADTPDR